MRNRPPADWFGAGRTALVFVCFYVVTLLAIAGCTTMAERAQTAAVADSVTTVGAIALGATELNPLGLLTIPAKIGALAYAETLPDDEQAQFKAMVTPMWGGAAVSNGCLMVAILTGGGFGAMCMVAGFAYGWSEWRASEAEREFYARCSAYRRESGETFRCAYRIEVAEIGH